MSDVTLAVSGYFLTPIFANRLASVPVDPRALLLGLPLTAIDPRLLAFAFITRALFTGTDIIGLSPLVKVGFKPEAPPSQ